MKITTFRHENVKPDGTFENRTGAIHTDGMILRSQQDGGCELATCRCSEGHWITIVHPRTEDGVVTGMTAKFDSQEEMDEYLKP